jgi:hypothetical protein
MDILIQVHFHQKKVKVIQNQIIQIQKNHIIVHVLILIENQNHVLTLNPIRKEVVEVIMINQEVFPKFLSQG